VPLEDLEQGRDYQVALTNHRGLYRYVIDDVFRIDEWYEELPIVRFSHRIGLTSSLTGEKLTEDHVVIALDQALHESGVRLHDAQLAPHWGSPPHYLLVIEAEKAPRDRLIALLSKFESALTTINGEYAFQRNLKKLDPPELLLASAGTFEILRSQARRGRSDAQVKVSKLRRDPMQRSDVNVDAVITWREVESTV
jgi:hypothetical protein